jgi:hypothetical protein
MFLKSKLKKKKKKLKDSLADPRPVVGLVNHSHTVGHVQFIYLFISVYFILLFFIF